MPCVCQRRRLCRVEGSERALLAILHGLRPIVSASRSQVAVMVRLCALVADRVARLDELEPLSLRHRYRPRVRPCRCLPGSATARLHTLGSPPVVAAALLAGPAQPRLGKWPEGTLKKVPASSTRRERTGRCAACDEIELRRCAACSRASASASASSAAALAHCWSLFVGQGHLLFQKKETLNGSRT